eukprot:1332451-Pyramimonas_sp.AAC.1
MLNLMSIRRQMRCLGPERPYQRSRGLASLNLLASWWPPRVSYKRRRKWSEPVAHQTINYAGLWTDNSRGRVRLRPLRQRWLSWSRHSPSSLLSSRSPGVNWVPPRLRSRLHVLPYWPPQERCPLPTLELHRTERWMSHSNDLGELCRLRTASRLAARSSTLSRSQSSSKNYVQRLPDSG